MSLIKRNTWDINHGTLDCSQLGTWLGLSTPTIDDRISQILISHKYNQAFSSFCFTAEDSLDSGLDNLIFNSNYSVSSFPCYDTSFPNYWLKNKVKLFKAEAQLGIPREKILAILSDEGYTIHDDFNIDLSHHHLSVLANVYTKSINRLFKRTRKKLDDLEFTSKVEFGDFFRPFIQDSENLEIVEIFDSTLNSNLIEHFVFRALYDDQECIEFFETYNHIFKKLGFKLSKTERDRRVDLAFILVSHHYYMFDDEEDLNYYFKFLRSSCTLINWRQREFESNSSLNTSFDELNKKTKKIYRKLTFVRQRKSRAHFRIAK